VKKYPDALIEGEEVIVTEKIHGTQCQMGYYRGEFLASSKLYGAHNQALALDESNDGNLYVRMARQCREALAEINQDLQRRPDGPHPTFYVVGEIYGRGV